MCKSQRKLGQCLEVPEIRAVKRNKVPKVWAEILELIHNQDADYVQGICVFMLCLYVLIDFVFQQRIQHNSLSSPLIVIYYLLGLIKHSFTAADPAKFAELATS